MFTFLYSSWKFLKQYRLLPEMHAGIKRKLLLAETFFELWFIKTNVFYLPCCRFLPSPGAQNFLQLNDPHHWWLFRLYTVDRSWYPAIFIEKSRCFLSQQWFLHVFFTQMLFSVHCFQIWGIRNYQCLHVNVNYNANRSRASLFITPISHFQTKRFQNCLLKTYLRQ